MPEDSTTGTTTEAATVETTTESETMLPQSAVNKMVGQARVEARNAFLKEFGFESKDDVKAALEEAATIRQSQMTETEKVQNRVAELEAALADATKAAEAATLANLRARIGREKGLPEAIIAKLTGTDEESITEECDEIAPLLSKETASTDVAGGTRPPGAESATPTDPLAAAIQRSLSRRTVI